MNNVKKMVLVGLMSVCLSSGLAFGTGWAWEAGSDWNNQMSTPAAGASYSFDIGNSNKTWYWDYAGNVNPLTSPMRIEDINGGASKWFGMKFQFSQPIASFQFVTPQMNTHTALVTWSYSTDGSNWTTLFERQGSWDPLTSFGPEVTTLQNFGSASTVNTIYLHYNTSPSYCSQVTFYDGVDDGGLLNVTTVPEPVTMILLGLGGLVGIIRRK